MSQDVWLAYCERSRLLSLDALSGLLTDAPFVAVHREPAQVLKVTIHDSVSGSNADVSVRINQDDRVTVDAAELASRLRSGRLTVDDGVPLPNSDVLAKADCRYELRWASSVTYETYNGRVVLITLLQQECGAIAYDATNHRLL